jgi:lysophospholipase L1-like esterase
MTTTGWTTKRFLRALIGAAIITTIAVGCTPRDPTGNPNAPKIYAIGDSLTYGVQDLAQNALVGNGWQASVTGHGGFAVADEFDTIDRAVAANPGAMLIALGTNDIRKIAAGQQTTEGFRSDVDAALAKMVNVSCVAWVGVNTYNGDWGPGGDHRVVGPAVNQIINDEMGKYGRLSGGKGAYGDWGTSSYGHMEYFEAPGNVHFTDAGNAAYTKLFVDTAAKCGNAPTAGVVDTITGGSGQVYVAGWAFNRGSVSPVTVDVTVSGAGGNQVASGTVTTNIARADVAAVFPGVGPNQGYATTVTTPTGTWTVCVSARHGTSTTLIGCRNIVVRDPSPFGSVDVVTASPGHVRVAGWTIDGDSPQTSIPVHVYVDNVGTAITANNSRTDVASAYAGLNPGPNHGFDATITAATGTHTVYIYGINVGAGTNVLIGWRTITVP